MVEYLRLFFIDGSNKIYRRYKYSNSENMAYLMNTDDKFLYFSGDSNIDKDNRNTHLIRKSDIARIEVYNSFDKIEM